MSVPAAVMKRPGLEAIAVKGWLRAWKWLLLRRASQLGFLGLFLLGPLVRLVDRPRQPVGEPDPRHPAADRSYAAAAVARPRATGRS